MLSSYSCTKNQCPVGMHYAEGSSWKGMEVEDMVSVGGEDADEEAYPLRFGCQTDITGLFEDQIPDGIFGMNKESGSAIKQWSKVGYLDDSAFSLCYNLREDLRKKSGVMVLGGTDTRLHEKPMVYAKDVGRNNYEVRIKDIRLKRGPSLSRGSSTPLTAGLGLDGTDTATLDSATTCTYLSHKWRKSLEEAWRQTTGGKYPMFTHLSITEKELDELPTLVFELEAADDKNGTIVLDYPPMRYMEKSESGGYGFCMYASETAGSVVLGNTFMSGHDVLHDLDNQRIGFAESKCEIHTITEKPAGLSVETDQFIEAPPKMKLIKPVVALQPEPIHKRPQNSAPTPYTGFAYTILVCGGVALIGVVLCSCGGCNDDRDGVNKASFWNAPNTKHAYQLSCISLVLTVVAIVAGVGLYMVSRISKRSNCLLF